MKIKFGVHNINGLKNNNSKLADILEFSKENEIEILGISETNISSKEGSFLGKDITGFRSFWASSEENKKKGSGVGIAISKRWERHLAKVETTEAYLIKASFIFSRTRLVFWNVYMPPNNKQTQKRIQQQIIKAVTDSKLDTYHIIGGDFNTVENTDTDKAKNKKGDTRKKLPLFSWLRNLGFVETFRACNPMTEKYTWSNGKSASRIDYIWISEGLEGLLRQSDIEEMELVTQSDHNLVWVEINTRGLLRAPRVRTGDSRKATKKVYTYDKATKENWEDYRTQLDNIVSVEYGKYQKERAKRKETRSVDRLWDIVSKAVGKAAANNIPRTRVSKYEDIVEPRKERKPYQKELKLLARLQKIMNNRENEEIDEIDRFLYDEQITSINRLLETEIPCTPKRINRQWHTELKRWWKAIKAKAITELAHEKEKKIRENIEKRYSMIVEDQRRMLCSILEKPRRRCRIDRVLKEN